MAKINKKTLLFYISAILALALFFLFKALTASLSSPSWDESVYILMGKYIYSLGRVGIWESLRPPIQPIILGAIWRLGLNPIFYGHIFSFLVSFSTIFLLYLIGREIFDKKIALTAVLFLCFSSPFIIYFDSFFTEIPSTCLGLLAVFLWLKKRWFLSGFACSLSFLTRFPQGLIFAGILSVMLIFPKEFGLKKCLKFLGGFLSLTFLYLAANYIIYRDPILPFSIYLAAFKEYASLWEQGFGFYFDLLIKKDNILALFLLFGLIFLVQKRRPRELLVGLLAIGFLLYFTSLGNKLERYIIPALPYIYLVSAYGLFAVLQKTIKYRSFYLTGLGLLAALFLFQKAFWLVLFKSPPISKDIFQQYVQYNEKKIKGSLWISNPTMLVYSNLKADTLIYYPVFDSFKAEQLIGNLGSADWIFFNAVDFPCVPGDLKCPRLKEILIENINKKFRKVLSRQDSLNLINGGGIYRRE